MQCTFHWLPTKTTQRHQLIQNSAAVNQRWEHISPVLAALHWLLVMFRVDLKVLLLVCKAFNGQGPSYIVNSLVRYSPSRIQRSSDAGLLKVPSNSKKKTGDAAFFISASKIWNALPREIWEASSVEIFKRKLKTHLFSLAFLYFDLFCVEPFKWLILWIYTCQILKLLILCWFLYWLLHTVC